MKLVTFNILCPIVFLFTMFLFWNNIEYLRVIGLCWGLGIWFIGNIIPSSRRGDAKQVDSE